MSTNSYPPLISLIIIGFLHIYPSIIVGSARLAPALYVFGDSLLDHGNNNLLSTIAKANYSPYGKDFVHGSTGRFTNGKTVADFITEYLGLPYAPPYLSIRRNPVTLTGLNYASGACGILPETGSQFGKCLHLEDQIDLFNWTIKVKLRRSYRKPEELSHYLSKSIFLFSIGSNDYITNYLNLTLFDTYKPYGPRGFAQLLVNMLSRQLERLYSLGARKVIMFEIGPIGCIPTITRRQGKSRSKCVEDANRLVSYFNSLLPATLKNLTSTLKGSYFVLGHVNWLGYDAIQNPSKYGLEDASNPCCPTWRNGTSSCIPLLLPCPNRHKNYFWDAFHLTESVYSAIASRCINDKSVCIPFNLNELIKM